MSGDERILWGVWVLAGGLAGIAAARALEGPGLTAESYAVTLVCGVAGTLLGMLAARVLLRWAAEGPGEPEDEDD